MPFLICICTASFIYKEIALSATTSCITFYIYLKVWLWSKTTVLMAFFLANLICTSRKEHLWVPFSSSSGADTISLIHAQLLSRVSQRAFLVVQVVQVDLRNLWYFWWKPALCFFSQWIRIGELFWTHGMCLYALGVRWLKHLLSTEKSEFQSEDYIQNPCSSDPGEFLNLPVQETEGFSKVGARPHSKNSPKENHRHISFCS